MTALLVNKRRPRTSVTICTASQATSIFRWHAFHWIHLEKQSKQKNVCIKIKKRKRNLYRQKFNECLQSGVYNLIMCFAPSLLPPGDTYWGRVERIVQPQSNTTTSWQNTVWLNSFLATSRAVAPPCVQYDTPETVQKQLVPSMWHITRELSIPCTREGGVKTHSLLHDSEDQAPPLE